MKHFLLISCLILCSCSSEEDNSKRPVPNEPLPDVQFEPCPSPSLWGSVNPDPLIRECPPEDIAECPIKQPGWAWVPFLSVEEMRFSKQGGVRCITSSPNMLSLDYYHGCRVEMILVSDSINDPPHFIGVNSFRSLICPWFTATRVSQQVLHISVDENETEKEREMPVFVSGGNSGNRFTITQSAE